MIRFNCDYSEGAHPRILERLLSSNFEQSAGYGEDSYSKRAHQKIKIACEAPTAAVHLVVGGTQANLTVIAAILRPHQGVLAADTGHINVHEAGAIEATGHKVLSLSSVDGKLTALQIKEAYQQHYNDETCEHMVQPGMVYISQPTENGTCYTRQELHAIHQVCQQYQLPLFVDGARLGYALAAQGNDLTLPDIARWSDVFYIGGTKVGALLGEAIVITNSQLQKDFRSLIKQRGALLAKGRLLGIQFDELFTDDLYFTIAKHAIAMAMQIKNTLLRHNIKFLFDSPSNQQFPILPNKIIQYLRQYFVFDFRQMIDDEQSAIRICTSWATSVQDVARLCEALEQCLSVSSDITSEDKDVFE